MSNSENKNFFANALEAVKSFFITFGGKCKDLWFKFLGLFKKKEATATASAEASVDGSASSTLILHELTVGEKIKRFLKAEQGWLFVLPALILLSIFTFYPIINAFVCAFKENYQPTNKFEPYTGWGFENFKMVFTMNLGGANFLQCLINTVVITFISVPLSTLLALLISVALNSIKTLQKAYQTILFLPYLTNSLAMGAVFSTFFNVVGTPSDPNKQIGIVNMFLGLFGIEPIDWMAKGISNAWEIGESGVYIPWAKYIVAIVYDVWSGLPFKILILFSSLQSVNKQYYDAAKIDGASKSTTLWKITTPLIMPMISYLLITGIMGGMKQYNSIVGLFDETMGGSFIMGTMVGYIYNLKNYGFMGYAFAASLVLFLIIMIFTLINLQLSKKKVHY